MRCGSPQCPSFFRDLSALQLTSCGPGTFGMIFRLDTCCTIHRCVNILVVKVMVTETLACTQVEVVNEREEVLRSPPLLLSNAHVKSISCTCGRSREELEIPPGSPMQQRVVQTVRTLSGAVTYSNRGGPTPTHPISHHSEPQKEGHPRSPSRKKTVPSPLLVLRLEGGPRALELMRAPGGDRWLWALDLYLYL